MQGDTATILANLEAVVYERNRRNQQPGLVERVLALKAYQHARFAASYADLLASPRHAAAARFFLDELYGPHDFIERDAQFARVVPALGRLFPTEVVGTVAMLAELHALSESLDTAMSEALTESAIDDRTYASAWRATGRADDRERQIDLVVRVGQSLDRLTRRPLLSAALRMMRAPARAAGLSNLQRFLETGFETFKGMHGAEDFLCPVSQRERALATWLFKGSLEQAEGGILRASRPCQTVKRQ